MRYPSDVHYVFAIDVIDSPVQQMFEPKNKDGLKVPLYMHPRHDELENPSVEFQRDEQMAET